MVKRKQIPAISAALALALLLTAVLCGCSRSTAAPEPTAPAANVDSVSPEEPAEAPADETESVGQTEPPAAEPEVGRQDGERFEAVIILEGMEETVQYEHVRNDALGFEMDYDYESFARHSESDRERFVSVWDDAANPENYLEVTRSSEDAEAAAAAISAELSEKYEISRDDAFMLERAGKCIRIDASADVGGKTMPDHLQMVYIIPADDGCLIATAHYAIEGSEGFGRRFHYFMDSFTVIARQG